MAEIRNICEEIEIAIYSDEKLTQEQLNPIDLFVTGYTTMASIEIKDRERYNAEVIDNLGGHYIKRKKYNKNNALIGIDLCILLYYNVIMENMLFWGNYLRKDSFLWM